MGHGAIEISNRRFENRPLSVSVWRTPTRGYSSVWRDLQLRILILSPATGSEIDQVIKIQLIPSVSDLGLPGSSRKGLSGRASGRRSTSEVDTGMGRGGTIQTEGCQTIREIAFLPQI